MPHQRLHRGKEARAGGEILPAGVEISREVHFTLEASHVKEIPLHQEMVSVTLPDTWASHSHSVIGMCADRSVRWIR